MFGDLENNDLCIFIPLVEYIFKNYVYAPWK